MNAIVIYQNLLFESICHLAVFELTVCNNMKTVELQGKKSEKEKSKKLIILVSRLAKGSTIFQIDNFYNFSFDSWIVYFSFSNLIDR